MKAYSQGIGFLWFSGVLIFSVIIVNSAGINTSQGAANNSSNGSTITDIPYTFNTTIISNLSSTKSIRYPTLRTTVKTTKFPSRTPRVTTKRLRLTTNRTLKPTTSPKPSTTKTQRTQYNLKNISSIDLQRSGKQFLADISKNHTDSNFIPIETTSSDNTTQNSADDNHETEDYEISVSQSEFNTTTISEDEIPNKTEETQSNDINEKNKSSDTTGGQNEHSESEISETDKTIESDGNESATQMTTTEKIKSFTLDSAHDMIRNISSENKISDVIEHEIKEALVESLATEVPLSNTTTTISSTESTSTYLNKINNTESILSGLETKEHNTGLTPQSTEIITLMSTTPIITTSVTPSSTLIQTTTEQETTTTKETTTSTIQRSTTQEVHPGKYKLVCFYSSWAIYRQLEDCKMPPNKINPHLCTHLMYAFAKISDNKLTSTDAGLDLDQQANFDSKPKEGNYRKFTRLKLDNPRLKTMLSVGGYNVNSSVFSEMAFSSSNRQTFILSVMQLLREYDFDGLDVCWQYPTFPGGAPEDILNFPLLLKELRETIDKETIPAGKNKLLLSISVAASSYYIKKAYIIDDINPHVDFINVMTYNYHGPSWESTIGHNSPLYKGSEETKGQETLNVAWSLNEWHDLGASAYKLLMGIAFFGNAYTLKVSSEHDIGSPHANAARPGVCTKQPGILAYNELCSIRDDKDWIVSRIEERKAPYAFSSTQWVGYDDQESIKEKSKFITKNKFGGAFVWTIDYDDFSGRCNKGNTGNINTTYPLLNILKSSLLEGGELE